MKEYKGSSSNFRELKLHTPNSQVMSPSNDAADKLRSKFLGSIQTAKTQDNYYNVKT